MDLKEARHLEKVFPERYRIKAKILRGDDKNIPLFMYKLEVLKDYAFDFEEVFNSHPFGVGRNGNTVVDPISKNIYFGEWLTW